jgi:acyl-coenzyme A synthetase/AMP-(fatty) acid ligase
MGRPLAGAVIRLAEPSDDTSRTTILTPWMGLRTVGAGGLQAGRPHATSDRVVFDADGNVQLHGRHDDVLNLNGKKVSLGALRESLAPLLSGAEFAVVPGHGDTGSHLTLHVEASPLTVQEIQAACARALPSFAIPRHIVLHRQFPRSSTGKVLLAQLEAQAAAMA